MAVKMVARSLVALLALAGSSSADWRMSCSVTQEGRIGSVASQGKVASQAGKIAGASNIGPSSTFESLQTGNCTSCEIQADRSTYWTPTLYYEHSNGSLEEIIAPGMTVYYLGNSDIAEITPFPAGFRMVSGHPLIRSINKVTKSHNDVRSIPDRVSFTCLDTAAEAETPDMSETSCVSELRAQVHFQSCWNGIDLYKPDNSHVAYLFGMDSGDCPSGYPVRFMHISLEVSYSIATIDQDGGRFVFGNSDTTGLDFHGAFMNGWDSAALTSAIESCNGNSGDLASGVTDCPAFIKDVHDDTPACTQQRPPIKKPVTGLIEKLPGCITLTNDSDEATEADIICAHGELKRDLSVISYSTGNGTVGTVGATGTVGTALGTAASTGQPPKSLNGSKSTGQKSILARSTGTLSGFITAPSASAIHLTTVPTITTAPAPIASPTKTMITPANGYIPIGCYAAAKAGGLVLTGSHYTDVESMTIHSCTSYCEARGLGFAGIEGGRECYCGTNNLGVKVVNSACDLPCKGNPTEACGGLKALSIWQSG